MNESDLKRDVAKLLTSAGLLHVRINSGGYRNRMKGAPAGTPDFVGWFADGRGFAIETKATHVDKCSCSSCVAQREWAEKAKKSGVLYMLVRSVSEVVWVLDLAA